MRKLWIARHRLQGVIQNVVPEGQGLEEKNTGASAKRTCGVQRIWSRSVESTLFRVDEPFDECKSLEKPSFVSHRSLIVFSVHRSDTVDRLKITTYGL